MLSSVVPGMTQCQCDCIGVAMAVLFAVVLHCFSVQMHADVCARASVHMRVWLVVCVL